MDAKSAGYHGNAPSPSSPLPSDFQHIIFLQHNITTPCQNLGKAIVLKPKTKAEAH